MIGLRLLAALLPLLALPAAAEQSRVVDLETLEARAGAGDREAMLMLASLHLGRHIRDADPEKGFALLVRATTDQVESHDEAESYMTNRTHLNN